MNVAYLFDKTLVQEKMLGWERLLRQYTLPTWEDFPALPLYMDQVTYLLNQYLTLLPLEDEGERQVTPAMINNYVKLKIIPAPIKKRYGRTHLAYLVVVCTLKQILNTSEIKKLLPLTLSEEEIRALYSAFVDIFHRTSKDYSEHVRQISTPVFAQDAIPVEHLIFRVAIVANLSKLLTEQLILLQGDHGEGEDAHASLSPTAP